MYMNLDSGKYIIMIMSLEHENHKFLPLDDATDAFEDLRTRVLLGTILHRMRAR